MLRRLVVLSALTIGSIAVAHADPISGFFSATGTDTFTSSSITFITATVGGARSETFLSYLQDGAILHFIPGALPYHNGMNTPPNPPFTTGVVPLFTVSGTGPLGLETFTFNMTDYTAGFPGSPATGCNVGSTCLTVTGDGTFSGTGAFSGTSGPATFVFTSQYPPGQSVGTLTTFSASNSAVAPSTVPEPTSLVLLGTGLLGVVGVARRRIKV